MWLYDAILWINLPLFLSSFNFFFFPYILGKSRYMKDNIEEDDNDKDIDGRDN